jgi:lipoprotein-anchoring transpeptidase ErfK/SrfK
MYVKKRSDNKGCLRLAGVLSVIVLLVGLWFIASWQARRRNRQAETPLPAGQEQPAAGPETTAPETQTADEPVPERTAPDQTAAGPPDPTNYRALYEKAQQLYQEGNLRAARARLFTLLEGQPHPDLRRKTEALLGTIHIQMVFTPRPMEEKTDYTLQRGDSLDRLARKFDTNKELIAKGNQVKGALIHEGDRFRILQGEFSIVVDRSDNDLLLKLNDRFFKRYRVGTGKFEKTPLGDFEITGRTPQPVWWRPDGKRVPYGHPDNLLGTHWLSLNLRGYGLHGTWEPDTIGKHASAGCVRLLNEDIEELYTLVPVGTPVTIKD